jgi:hypothetical protein
MLKINKPTLFLGPNNNTSKGLSMDWIHNLVYYNQKNEIIVFNLTNPVYGFVVVNEKENIITDLSVNPLDSFIIYIISDAKMNHGKIMKISQDGSERKVLIDENIEIPKDLTFDFKSRKIFWLDKKNLRSCDYEGNNSQTIFQSEVSIFSGSIEIFDDDIFWNTLSYPYLHKTRETGQIHFPHNFITTPDNNWIRSFKIIHSSLQPNSSNRCITARCPYLCLPIRNGVIGYRCVQPKVKLPFLYDPIFSSKPVSARLLTTYNNCQMNYFI